MDKFLLLLTSMIESDFLGDIKGESTVDGELTLDLRTKLMPSSWSMRLKEGKSAELAEHKVEIAFMNLYEQLKRYCWRWKIWILCISSFTGDLSLSHSNHLIIVKDQPFYCGRNPVNIYFKGYQAWYWFISIYRMVFGPKSKILILAMSVLSTLTISKHRFGNSTMMLLNLGEFANYLKGFYSYCWVSDCSSEFVIKTWDWWVIHEWQRNYT